MAGAGTWAGPWTAGPVGLPGALVCVRYGCLCVCVTLLFPLGLGTGDNRLARVSLALPGLV